MLKLRAWQAINVKASRWKIPTNKNVMLISQNRNFLNMFLYFPTLAPQHYFSTYFKPSYDVPWNLWCNLYLFKFTFLYCFTYLGGGELYTWGSNENGCLGIGYIVLNAFVSESNFLDGHSFFFFPVIDFISYYYNMSS